MPRYHFDFEKAGIAAPDDDGVEMPSLDAARLEAVRAAAAVLKDQADGHEGDLAIHVRGPTGAHLLTVTAAIRIARFG